MRGSVLSHVIHMSLLLPPHTCCFLRARSKLAPLLTTQRCLSVSTTVASVPSPLPLYTHFGILRLCFSARSLEQAQQAHALAITTGAFQLRTASFSSSLMLAYAAFGFPSTSHVLFNQIVPNVFLWNTLLRVNSLVGAHHSAFDTYNRMVCCGIQLDDHTFPFILKVCADAVAVEKGMEIHGLVFKLGFHGDVFVGNTLISFYASAMRLSDSHQVFSEMLERDLVSWNSIMVAFSLHGYFSNVLDWFLKLRFNVGLKPNSISIVSVLPACAGLQDEETTREIHGYVVKSGLSSYVTICNALIDSYGKCGNCQASKLVYDQMDERNLVSLNAIMSAFAHNGLREEALEVFRLMVALGNGPDSITLSTFLPVLIEMEGFNKGKEIHGYSIRRSINFDVFVSNCLIDLYAKSGHSTQASNVFETMERRSVVTWNVMVANFVLNKLELEAIRLMKSMQTYGEHPNSVTFTNVLPAIGRVGSLLNGKEIHAVSIRKGFSFDLYVSNALMDMYAKCCCLHMSQNIFKTSAKDEVSYNILITSYSQSEHCLEAIDLFSEMTVAGLKHDIVSFTGVLSACANLFVIKQGKEIHAFFIRTSHSHIFVANSLLDMYTKCGKMDLARRVFNQIPDKDVVSWNTMILGYGMLGEVDVAVDLFESMRDSGVDYDLVSYLAVLSACSHSGHVERGLSYFNVMLSRDIKPTNMHYACMVDLLGRAGRIKEAVEIIREMPNEADANIWGSLLGACKIHGNIGLGRWVAEHLFELKPKHCGYYMLLSNMYAELGKWEEANETRELMKLKGVKKNPGCSWVVICDQIHILVARKRLEGHMLGPFVINSS